MAEHISRDLSCFDFRRLVTACAPIVGLNASGSLAAGEDLTARALASAGLAALVALPFLLLWSLLFSAPLALPAAIGLGYLAVSHALAAQHRRRAAFINAFVLCGLVSWLLLYLLIGDGQASHAGLMAALMAPLFAAAPAFARTLMSARKARLTPVAPDLRDAAQERGVDPMDVSLCPESERATLSLGGDGAVAMRLQSRADPTPIPAMAKAAVCPAARTVHQPHRPRCDIGEAVAFALRHAEPKAEAKQVVLTSAVEPDVAAACDRQIGRRILHLLIDSALNGSEAGGVVHLIGRRLKGVVLLRVVSEPGTEPSAAGVSDARFDIAPLRSLVDIAGGTLVVDRQGHDIALSVRLDLAVAREAKTRVDENA